MKVLVCGDRDWSDREFLEDTLGKQRAIWSSELNWVCLIEGGARGADTMAGEWADKVGICRVRVPAQWDYYKKSAGPIRNGVMLYLNPDLVIAFHNDIENSRGTAHMVSIARKKGTKVEIYKKDE